MIHRRAAVGVTLLGMIVLTVMMTQQPPTIGWVLFPNEAAPTPSTGDLVAPSPSPSEIRLLPGGGSRVAKGVVLTEDQLVKPATGTLDPSCNCDVAVQRSIAEVHLAAFSSVLSRNAFVASKSPFNATFNMIVTNNGAAYTTAHTACKLHNCTQISNVDHLRTWQNKPISERKKTQLLFGAFLLNPAVMSAELSFAAFAESWAGPANAALILEHPLNVYLRTLNSAWDDKKVAASGMTPVELFVDDLINGKAGMQYEKMSLAFQTLVDERAISHYMEGAFAVVGVSEQLPESLCLLDTAFGWKDKLYVPDLPDYEAGPFRADMLTEEAMSHFLRVFHKELLIYETAKILFQRQLNSTKGSACRASQPTPTASRPTPTAQ